MIPEFTQAIFIRSLDEWGQFPAKFDAMSPEEQAAFLKEQGYGSLHDLLAHAGVWWEEGEGIVRDALGNRERPYRKYDFDEFNAASLKRFRDTPEPEFTAWYESQRRRMIDLVSSLDEEQIKLRRVYGWLNAVTLMHLKEHAIDASRFVTLDMLEREWAAYPERVASLPPDKGVAFLQKQGVPRIRDLLAHILAWWEKGGQIIDAVAKDPSYRVPDIDVDAYNAEILDVYGRLDEDEIYKKYESTRQVLIELAINLPDATFHHKEVQAWLKSDVIQHYFDHAI